METMQDTDRRTHVHHIASTHRLAWARLLGGRSCRDVQVRRRTKARAVEGEGKACIFMVVLTSEPLVAGSSSSSSDSTSSQGTLFCAPDRQCVRGRRCARKRQLVSTVFRNITFEHFFWLFALNKCVRKATLCSRVTPCPSPWVRRPGRDATYNWSSIFDRNRSS